MIGIRIQRDRTHEILGLSQKAYIDKMLDRCDVMNCSKRDKFSLLQYPMNNLQKEQMKDIPYASVVKSLVYAQVCTYLDISIPLRNFADT